LGTFGPAQQTALAQLAIQYCSQMVENASLRTAFFGNTLDPQATATSTFGTAGSPNTTNRDTLIEALLTKGKNTGLEWDAAVDDMLPAEIDALIDRLVGGPTGSASGGTGTVLKATCGAVLGSGATLIQ
jgi:hypothetical protein